eukprot:CAMPEP_0119279244 /NCGR_PEP_ID=MMETSP1329-20130426/20455_1 /TAXON_ID=114041 /ORGANISM="Genus nov. species nov., Strain RCC1024" /LENGTH=118 /DNA_ID=CAMNT_0007279781 /DNA_START=162 /DNA_END=515 /DNA_ORIENTATION=+
MLTPQRTAALIHLGIANALKLAATTTHDLGAFAAAVKRHRRGVTTDFCSNGLPAHWTAAQSRGAFSGLTGALFVAPALATPLLGEQALWLGQACCSVLADYVFIAAPHPMHGVDRIAA